MMVHKRLARRENHGGTRDTGDIRYLVVHYTGNKGDTAKNNALYFSRDVAKASAHYFVDESEIWQSVEENVVAWHCGGELQGSGGHKFHRLCTNSNSIGVEICMLDKQGALRQGSMDNALPLLRALMAKYNIPADRVIRHYDVTGKLCPQPLVSAKAWDSFKKGLIPMEDKNQPAPWAQTAWDRAKAAGILDGTRPKDPVTRQELAVILDRLGLVRP